MKLLFNLLTLITVSSCVSPEMQFPVPFPKSYDVRVAAAEIIETNDSKWLLRVKDGLVRKRTFAIMKSTPELASPASSGVYEFVILTFVEATPSEENIRAIHPVRFLSPEKIFIGGTCGMRVDIEFISQ